MGLLYQCLATAKQAENVCMIRDRPMKIVACILTIQGRISSDHN